MMRRRMAPMLKAMMIATPSSLRFPEEARVRARAESLLRRKVPAQAKRKTPANKLLVSTSIYFLNHK
jgi:hypothetical protein